VALTATMRRSRGCTAISLMRWRAPGNGRAGAAAQPAAGAVAVKNRVPTDVPTHPSTAFATGLCGSGGPNVATETSPWGAGTSGAAISGFHVAPPSTLLYASLTRPAMSWPAAVGCCSSTARKGAAVTSPVSSRVPR
jgi:hypothetical protein